MPEAEFLYLDWKMDIPRIDRYRKASFIAIPTEGGATTFLQNIVNEFKCFPDTMDPRGPK